MHRIVLIFTALLVLLAGCSAPPTGPRIDNIPMYGQPGIPRPDLLQQADADFISKATAGFGGDRKAASQAWAEQASRFLSQGNLDYAMRRYNQAWLLDDTNYEAYWGFGRVMVETDQFEDGVKFMRRAVELCRDPIQLPAVYSDLGVACSYLADSLPLDRSSERSTTFAAANAAFAQSVGLNAQYGNAWRRWAIALAMEGKYAEAAEKARRARELGAPPLPARFLKAIEAAAGPIN